MGVFSVLAIAATVGVVFLPSESWIVGGCYWLLLSVEGMMDVAVAPKLYSHDDTEENIGFVELVEFALVAGASTLGSFALGCATLCVIAVRRLLWNDMRIPTSFRVDQTYYASGKRRFLVTGAASGVGRHMVGVLCKQGHFVLATDVNLPQLQASSASDDWPSDLVKVQKLDVTSDADWAGAIAQCGSSWGGLDVLMNIAGFLKPGKIQEISARDLLLHVDVNVKGVFLGTMHASKLMVRHVAEGLLPKGGHIINFSSLGGIAPVPGVGPYVGSKYACRGFSLCASKDLFPAGVFVSCVMPDAIQTPMVDLQLHFDDSAMAYSGKILTLNDVEKVIMSRVLVKREREVLIPTSVIRGKGARLNDIFSGSLLLSFVAEYMKQQGLKKQEQRKRAANATVSDRMENVREELSQRLGVNHARGRSNSPPHRRSPDE